ncbi:MAG: aminotransferase class I/II-fold pyridoxal phosphate-dependent enzyme [Eubacteriales bacterium]
MDLFEKCFRYDAPQKAKEAGLYPYFHALSTAQDTEVFMDGKRIIMLGSNNYMGLVSDERLKHAAITAIEKYGTGCSGSRFLNGTLKLHEELEEEFAKFFNKPAALSFSTGFQTNLGTVSALMGMHDYILSDAENHASIVDATRLSFCKKTIKYRHNDMDSLEEKLKNLPAENGKLIVTDGVFSMGGDIANLPHIIRLAKKYGARVMVDDAHGAGMIGKNGRGTASYYGLEDETDIIMTTFSKAFGSLGGIIATSKEVVNFIKHTSRPFIFSASIPPASAAAALEALDIIKKEPERQKNLYDISNYMREKLKEANIPIMDGETAIIPVYTYTTQRTFIIAKMLFEGGVYVNPVVAPAVHENECLLRTSYTATHTKEQIDHAASIFKEVFSKV